MEIDLTEFSERLIEKGKKHQAERDRVSGPDLVFVIPAYEQKTALEWHIKHVKTCTMRFHKDGSPRKYPGGASGGLTSYKFTPTGIGLAIEVLCSCGESENITDYDNW